MNSAGLILPDALKELDVKYLISAGICFGLKPTKDDNEYQKYGDVLVATAIQDYDSERVGRDDDIARGERLPASPGLLQAVRMARDRINADDFKTYFSLVLSGQKLVDKEELVLELRKKFPEAVGDEMEGNAVAASSVYGGRQWILIKGICDWGMNKEDGWQELAANRACDLAVEAVITLMDAESP